MSVHKYAVDFLYTLDLPLGVEQFHDDDLGIISLRSELAFKAS